MSAAFSSLVETRIKSLLPIGIGTSYYRRHFIIALPPMWYQPASFYPDFLLFSVSILFPLSLFLFPFYLCLVVLMLLAQSNRFGVFRANQR